jgi:tRNA 2-thiouridine synthesizing protein A
MLHAASRPSFSGLPKPGRPRILATMGEILIDAQFMKCPMPVLRAAKTLRGMAAGEKLRVLATDPAAVGDFRDFCKQSGHALVATSETSGVFSFTIRRKPETT